MILFRGEMFFPNRRKIFLLLGDKLSFMYPVVFKCYYTLLSPPDYQFLLLL